MTQLLQKSTRILILLIFLFSCESVVDPDEDVQGNHGWPFFSPVTDEVLFLSAGDLFIGDLSGNKINLTRTPVEENSAVWSPNGDKVAYIRRNQSSEYNYDEGLFVINADGSNNRYLNINCFSADWFPDNQRLVFFDLDSSRLAMMDCDGKNYQTILPTNAVQYSKIHYLPKVAPDGKSIIFLQIASSGLFNLVKTDLSGGSVDTLATNCLNESPDDIGSPAWSHNGQKIVYISPEGIKTIHADGTNCVLIATDLQKSLHYPRWSHDDQKIAFCVYRWSNEDDANSIIYLINADGSNLTQFTDNSPGSDIIYRAPDWSMADDKIVYMHSDSYGCDAGDIYVQEIDGKEGQKIF